MDNESHDGAAVRVPPPLVYLGGVVVGALLHAYLTPFSLGLSSTLRAIMATALILLSLGLMAAAIGMFRSIGQDPKPWKSTPSILSTGIYRFTRNPMYVGMAAVQAGIGVALANGWIVILVVPVLVIVYWTAIRHEEAYLETKFGSTYTDYKSSVRRWL